MLFSQKSSEVTSFDKTYESTAPTLESIIKYKDEETAVLLITKEFTNYLSFVSVKDKVDAELIAAIVKFILEDYKHLTIADIHLFFRKCCKGEFGSNYNRIDGPTILQWLSKFDAELDEYITQRREQEHQAIKNNQVDVLEAIADQCPESAQRTFNKLSYGIACTDAELKQKLAEKKLVSEIRSRVYRKYSKLYDEHPADEVDKMIDDEIKSELMSNNLFQYV